MESIFNITADSLATHVGVIDNGHADQPDSTRSQMLKAQLGILQRKPRHEQMLIHHELAAKHLPILVEKYRANTGPLNSSMTLLNVISYTPYFVRFMRTSQGQGLAALQTKRTAQAATDTSSMTVDGVGEVGQFLATLLVLQGTGDVDESDKAVLIPKLKQWKTIYSGRLASDTSERCLALLTDDFKGISPMMQSVRNHLTSCLQRCGGPDCDRTMQASGAELMQCARCKSAVDCGVEHQKKAWPLHKELCFYPTF